MAVHADPVSHAMGEMLVVAAEAGGLDNRPGRGVHRLTRDTRLDCCGGGLLRFAFHIPDIDLAL